MVILLSLFLGTTLAAASGFRAFLPLFLLGVLARADLLEFFSIGEKFQWLTSDLAILTLGIATIVEVMADKFPAVDSALDAGMTVVRPAAGAMASMAVISSQDPTLAYVSGLVLAGGATLPVHLGKSALRMGSHFTTAGVGSPALSTAEDVASAGAVTLSVVVPMLAGMFGLASLALVGWFLVRRRRKKKLKESTA